MKTLAWLKIARFHGRLAWEAAIKKRPRRAVGVRAILAAATAGTTAAAAPAAARQGNFGSQGEPAACQVDGYVTYLLKQSGVHDKGISTCVFRRVGFTGFIQRQRQTGTAAAAGGEVNADGRFFFVGEIGVQLFAGAFLQCDHCESSMEKPMVS